MAWVAGRLRQCAAQARLLGRAFASDTHTGFVELREYTLKPEGMKQFMALTAAHVELRKSLLPFLGMFSCDTGGTLNRVMHFYHYDSFDQRDAARQQAAGSVEWQEEYLARSRFTVAHQESTIFLPATAVLQAAGAAPLQHYRSPPRPPAGTSPVVYELRQYQLHPGYGSVPKLLEAFQRGLPDKIAADPEGQLVHFGYTDVGLLNSVLELWRYPSAAACIQARQAARKVPVWRETIAGVTPGVQTFRSSFMHPLPFSPMQ